MTEPLLRVRNLRMHYKHPHDRRRVVHAVDDVSFDVRAGETLGVVGESGSGKSTIGRCIVGLETPTGGAVEFEGIELTEHSQRRGRRDIARRVQVVFQDPNSSLNPYRTVGQSLIEPLQQVYKMPTAEATDRARDILEAVGLPRAVTDRYPNQFSGGQRQRIGIARALIMDPTLVVCDEAVSALDLSTQAQVLNLLAELAKSRGLAYIFIAHDLDVVRYISDRTIVLYRGRTMESGPADAVHATPLHPYTAALVAAAPTTDPLEQRRRRELRRSAPARVATAGPATGQSGCPFAARCAFTQEVCHSRRPRDTVVGERTVACHMYEPDSGHTTSAEGAQAILAGAAL